MLINIAHWMRRIYYFVMRPITLGVRIMLVEDGKVILVKHSYQDGWFLPGGGVKRGETLEQAICREAAEECGATLNHVQFIGTYHNFVEHKSDHVCLFLSEDFSLHEKHDREIDKIAAFPLDQLPEDTTPGSQRKITAFRNGSLASSGMW
jgi:8-oxo-dGTP pyrophosphatase MutT (NUDIX family)